MKEQAMSETQPKTLPIATLKGAAWNTHRRSEMDDPAFRGLIESLKTNGMLHRVAVRHCDEDGMYEIIDGHRRAEAALRIGWTDIPCEIHYDLTDADAQALTATANIQRLENDPLLEAELIERLSGSGKTYVQIAAILGKDERYVARRARLCNLTEVWKAWFGQVEATADTMEFVAAHEKELQDEIFKALEIDGEDGDVDEDYIEREFKNRLRKLDETTPFDIYVAGCTTCPYNTANHGLLFPVEEDDDCKGRCERAACFTEKWNAATDAKIEELRKKKVAVKEAKQKWDVPSYWNATPNKERKNKEPWVYTEDGLKRIVWTEPRIGTKSAAPAKTVAEKAEERRIKKAHSAWDKARKSAYAKLRAAIGRDFKKSAMLARGLTSNPLWIQNKEAEIISMWTDGYAYDGECQKVFDMIGANELATLGVAAITEDEKTALTSPDPALAPKDTANGEEA